MTWDFKTQTKVFWFVDKNNVLIIIIKKTNLLQHKAFLLLSLKELYCVILTPGAFKPLSNNL